MSGLFFIIFKEIIVFRRFRYGEMVQETDRNQSTMAMEISRAVQMDRANIYDP
jgi:hypothetical protein